MFIKSSLIFRSVLLLLVFIFTAKMHAAPPYQAGIGTSLRFYGNGENDIDRVKIRIDGPARPADIGASDFTIEFWLMANPGENGSGTCIGSGDNWINGNTIIDRDIYGIGDYGDYGISLYGGVIAFGVNNGSSGTTLCGSTNVVDSQWHHIAVIRVRNTGLIQIYVDGLLDGAATGPTGDISYRNGRTTSWSNDPFIVIGAEKHDIDAIAYPSFSGWVDEIRLSNIRRYNGSFAPPASPFQSDVNTVGLYHFNEGSGTSANDSSGGGSHGVIRVGGTPTGPIWSAETPFSGNLTAPNLISPANSVDLIDTRPTFMWSAVAGASGYRIEISGSTGLIPPFTSVFETTTVNFRPSQPLLTGEYTWRVQAFNNNTQSEWSSPARSMKIVSPLTAAPARNLFTTASPTLSWNRITWATGYQIQVAANPSFTQIVLDETVNNSTLMITTPQLENGVYYWRLRALRFGIPGQWSVSETLTVHAE